MNVFGETNIGRVRATNQDELAYGELNDSTCFAVICDGMGGANGGNIASEIAVHLLEDRIRQCASDISETSSPEHMLASAMAAANIAVFDKAQSDPELDGMGTTVVAALMRDDTVYISHVGDSRLYLFRDKQLIQITRDHSVVQEMIERGQLTPEEARTHPRKHFITRALGVSDDESGEYDEVTLKPGDLLMLCTDGLTNMLDSPTITDVLTQCAPQEAVPTLIHWALEAGGTDNVTVVLMDHS